MTQARPYDLILYGASGYTGALVAEALAQALAGSGRRWALAGRHLEKLERVRSQLFLPAVGDMPDLLHADSHDEPSLQALARRCRVLVNTVGPYAELGDGLIRACIGHGCHYLDLCAEPAHVDHVRRHWHQLALKKKTCVLPCCGFESVPADLGVLYLLEQVRADCGKQLARMRLEVFAGIEAGGKLSGGSWASLLQSLAAGDWRRRHSSQSRVYALSAHPRYVPALQRWALPLPSIDGEVVRQSARLRADYGGQFGYGHFVLGKRWLPLMANAAVWAGLAAAVQVPALRRYLQERRPRGLGPDAEERARSWFRLSLLAESGGRCWRAEVQGGDPGYAASSHMLAQAALLLLRGEGVPGAYGVLTPATALGLALLPHLERAGIVFSRIVAV